MALGSPVPSGRAVGPCEAAGTGPPASSSGVACGAPRTRASMHDGVRAFHRDVLW